MSILSSLGGIGQSIAQAVQGVTSNNPTTTQAISNASQMLSGTRHRRHGGTSALFKQIQQAVTTALQQNKSVGASGATSASDPNQAVEAAIAQVLKTNAASPSSSSQSVQPPDDESSQTTAQNFFQTLQASGVTPEQFRNDLLAAVQQTGGQANLGQMAGSFPPGLLVDSLG